MRPIKQEAWFQGNDLWLRKDDKHAVMCRGDSIRTCSQVLLKVTLALRPGITVCEQSKLCIVLGRNIVKLRRLHSLNYRTANIAH